MGIFVERGVKAEFGLMNPQQFGLSLELLRGKSDKTPHVYFADSSLSEGYGSFLVPAEMELDEWFYAGLVLLYNKADDQYRIVQAESILSVETCSAALSDRDWVLCSARQVESTGYSFTSIPQP